MKTLAKLQSECADLGIQVTNGSRSSKEPYLVALRDYFWQKDHPGEPLPDQVMPMLLGDWNDLTAEQAEALEEDQHAWIAQPKLDGVRALLHIEADRIRITSRVVSEVTYRLSEFQDNVPHLHEGLSCLQGSILDGELVCPLSSVNTGTCWTEHPLQAVMAILATSPENARTIQDRHDAHLRFFAFDIVKTAGGMVTGKPLYDRLAILGNAIDRTKNRHIEVVPNVVVGKRDFHRRVLAGGGEGTVWKRADQPYEPGRRVQHWLKRKQATEVEAFVTGFKPGSPEAGNAQLVGAVEFSLRQADETEQPIAWVSNWSEDERSAMTVRSSAGISLRESYWRRRAVISGQERSARSGRLRHARFVRWVS